MKVSKLRIHNVLGIEHMELAPGRVTRVHGQNGLGKSSLRKSLQALASGGSGARLIRDGKDPAEPSEVFLLIEDDGATISITKRLSAEKSSPAVVKVNDVVQREPQKLIGLLMDSLAINPIDFVNAKPADQIQWLLSAMPLTITAEDFSEAGIDVSGWEIPTDKHGLVVLDQAYEWAYACRRDANVSARKAKDSAETLRGSLPTGNDEEVRSKIATLSAEHDSLTGEIAAYSSQKQAHLESAIGDLRAQADEARRGQQEKVDAARKKVERIQAELDEAKAAMQAEQAAIGRIDQVLDKEISELRLEAQRSVGKTESELLQKLSICKAALAAARTELEAFQRSEGLRVEYNRRVEDQRRANEESKHFDSIMIRIQEMKRKKLADLAIPDVEIRGNDIVYEGHLLETQNSAKAMILALQVCANRVKTPIVLPSGQKVDRLPLICLDGAECLDPQTYELIDDFAEQYDLQLIVTRVTGDEKLVVETT